MGLHQVAVERAKVDKAEIDGPSLARRMLESLYERAGEHDRVELEADNDACHSHIITPPRYSLTVVFAPADRSATCIEAINQALEVLGKRVLISSFLEGVENATPFMRVFGDGVNAEELAIEHALQVADELYPGVREKMVFVGSKATRHTAQLVRSLSTCSGDNGFELPWSVRHNLRALASVEANSGVDLDHGAEITPQQVLDAVSAN